ncbi:MAG TPA: tetratricopeptide repeat protein [Kofleriaceae bacterium]|nr:tetratricopeptide repeat protein [Kofleriaceae bacterium]
MVTIRTTWLRALIGAGAVLALAGGATAAPDEALRKARKLAAAGKHAEAVAAFEQVVKAHPDDVAAQAELGFEAYKAKDYAKAEAVTRAAIAKLPAAKASDADTSQADRTRGAALYNLGLILEATNRPKDAATAYAGSLDARASRAARTRLQKLDPALAAKHDPLAPDPLAGPFASLTATCEAARKDAPADPPADWDEGESCARPPRIAIAGAPTPPFDEVVAYQTPPKVDLHIAVRIGKQWYRYSFGSSHDLGEPGGGDGEHCGATTYKAVRIGALKREVPALQLEYTGLNEACERRKGGGHYESWGWNDRGLVVIGVGPSGKPSGMPPLLTHEVDWFSEDEGKKTTSRAGLTLTWAPGALDVGGKAPQTGTEPLDAEGLLGHHVIAFP